MASGCECPLSSHSLRAPIGTLPRMVPKASRTPALGALSHEPTSMLRLLLMTALIGHALGGGADLTVNQKEVRHG